MERAWANAGYIARALHLQLIRSSSEMIDGGEEWEQTRGVSPMGSASRLPQLQCRNLCRSGAGQSRARGLSDIGRK
jgi:hypothetical protein